MDIISKAKKKHNVIAGIFTSLAFIASLFAMVYGSREEGAGFYLIVAGTGTLVSFVCFLYGCLWPEHKTISDKTYSAISTATGIVMGASGNIGAAAGAINNAYLAQKTKTDKRPLLRKQWGNWATLFVYWGIAPLSISLIIGVYKETHVWSPFSSFMIAHLILMIISAYPSGIWTAADKFKYYGIKYPAYKKRILVMTSVMIAIELAISIITIITSI